MVQERCFFVLVLSLSLTLCLKTVKPGLPQSQCSALCFPAGRWDKTGAAAMRLLPTERRLVADGLCFLTLYLLSFGRFASTACVCVCVCVRVCVAQIICGWSTRWQGLRCTWERTRWNLQPEGLITFKPKGKMGPHCSAMPALVDRTSRSRNAKHQVTTEGQAVLSRSAASAFAAWASRDAQLLPLAPRCDLSPPEDHRTIATTGRQHIQGNTATPFMTRAHFFLKQPRVPVAHLHLSLVYACVFVDVHAGGGGGGCIGQIGCRQAGRQALRHWGTPSHAPMHPCTRTLTHAANPLPLGSAPHTVTLREVFFV